MGSNVLEKTGLTGSVQADFIFFDGQRIGSRNSSSTVTYFNDHLRSARMSAGVSTGASTATIQWDADYYPFGRIKSYVSSSAPAFRFTGKELDTETGLDDFGARYYSSNVGRFMSPDPTILSVTLSDPRTWNRYTYVLNNPTSSIDTNGKWTKSEHERIIDDVFGFMSEGDINLLKQASAEVDQDQSKEGARKHAMSTPGQSALDASQAAGEWIDENLNNAVQAQLAWENQPSDMNDQRPREMENAPDALKFFGYALHTVTDMWSPEHIGFQEWDGFGDGQFDMSLGYFPSYNDVKAVTHVRREVYSSNAPGVISSRSEQLRGMAEYEARLLWERYQSMLNEARKKRDQSSSGSTSSGHKKHKKYQGP